MLSLQKYLLEHGLNKTVEDFKLKVRDYGHKILLKYDQIESDMKLPEVQDARGIILENGTWKVMGMSFQKFFNSAEGSAARIDWETALIQDKMDGSLIQLYWDWHKSEWYAATTGTGEGEGEVNNKLNTTFGQLFFQTLAKYYVNLDNFSHDYTYVFELTTPYNIVVKPHGQSSITLLTARNNDTLEEIAYDELISVASILGVPLVNVYNINAGDVSDVIALLEGMPWSEEGYVVVDANFNRIKIKNPAYVAVHHLKSKTAEHNILTIIKTNEVEEFAATFPERKEELYKLKVNYDALVVKLEDLWKELEPFKSKDDSPAEKKTFAMKVFELVISDLKPYTGLYFGLNSGKIKSVQDYMLAYDDKALYKVL